MQCEICKRSPSSKLPFNCTFCARDSLYQARLQHAEVLLQKESLERQIEGTLKGGKTNSNGLSTAETIKIKENSAWTVECALRERAASEARTDEVLPHIEALRNETQKMREDISARKANIQQRRSELESAKRELERSRAAAIEPLEKGVRRTRHRWDLLHSKTAESRLFLCREAAHLYGLSEQKRKKGTPGKEIYSIGGTPIADIKDLNSTSASEITTSNSQVAHLTHLLSHYLSLRLPAEITLPHRDYPFPTIFSPTSSYTTNRSVPFPGTTPTHSSSTSPSTSRHHHGGPSDQLRPFPRPRILHLDKPLAILAKEDQLAYSSFVEGITFLAWDIAWLCRTQGLPTGTNTWEDICNMGRNLYQLVFAGPTLPLNLPPNISKAPTASSQPSTSPRQGTRDKQTSTTPSVPLSLHFSHNSSYAFLAAADGTDYMMQGWRLKSPLKAVESVKRMLLAERTGAEWEILDGEEWASVRPVVEDDGKLVGGQQGDPQPPGQQSLVDLSGVGRESMSKTITADAKPSMDRIRSANQLKPRMEERRQSSTRQTGEDRWKSGDSKRVDETGVLVPPVSITISEKDERDANANATATAHGWMKVKSRSNTSTNTTAGANDQ